MKVLLFGLLADEVGDTAIEIKGVTNTEELKRYLTAEYPTLSRGSFQIAINREQVTSVIPLNEDDEIALLPPFAGG